MTPKFLIHSLLSQRAVLSVALLTAISVSGHASAAVGSWDLSGTYYGGAIVTESFASDGDAPVGLVISQTSSLPGNLINGYENGFFYDGALLDYGTGAPVTFSSSTAMTFDSVVDFGPASGWTGAAGGASDNQYNGFGFTTVVPDGRIDSGTITISLAGGGVFGALDGSLRKLELTAGGVGSSFATFTWNNAISSDGPYPYIDFSGLFIVGGVTGITVDQSFTSPVYPVGEDFGAPTTNFQVGGTNATATPIPEPSLITLIGAIGVMGLLRRRP